MVSAWWFWFASTGSLLSWMNQGSALPCSSFRPLPSRPRCFLRPAYEWSSSVMSNSLQPHGLQTTRFLCPWDFPGKSAGRGCHFLLQEIFPTQVLNPGLPHCRQTLYHLSHQGSPAYEVIPSSRSAASLLMFHDDGVGDSVFVSNQRGDFDFLISGYLGWLSRNWERNLNLCLPAPS